MNLRDSLTSANELPAALKVGSLALGFLLSYIAPVQSFLIAVAVLVCADVVTGVWASHRRGEAINAKGGTPADPPCDTYFDELPAIKDCALLKLAHPDSFSCWNSTENYRTAVAAWETQWAELECDTF